MGLDPVLKTQTDDGGSVFTVVLLATSSSGWALPSSWARSFMTVSVAVASIIFVLQTIGNPAGGVVRLHPRQQALPCDVSSFVSALPPNATIEKVASVPELGSYGEGPPDEAYPWIPTGMPALCAVTVRVISSPSSSYRFGLFLPAPDKWQGRFLAVGNGGFSGGINWIDMAPGPHYGMAAVSTDTGHNGTMIDTAWALNQPEKRTDWGWRAMHGTVVHGKALVAAYYSRPAAHSYYNGCSTGGRQGLREVQKFPDSFDGALIGAPAWWTTHLNNWITKVGTDNFPASDPKHIPMTLLPFLAHEARAQCDAQDGVVDSIVSNPMSCKYDFSKLLCTNSTPLPDPTSFHGRNCLTPIQLQTAMNIYGDYRSASGELLYPGLTISSESQWPLLIGEPTGPSGFGVGYDKDFLYDDPNWKWGSYNDSAIAEADARDPGQCNADNYGALKAYKQRGGKMILYHGLADGLVPTKGSLMYYDKTVQAFGGDLEGVRDFFRMFLVPGMHHCWNTDDAVKAPWNFGGATQAGAMGMGEWSVPGFKDARHDAMLAMIGWVEGGKVVEEIVATSWHSRWNASSGVVRQRPLCPWPEKALYNGVGDVNAANSWRCS